VEVAATVVRDIIHEDL